jgi:hypothetical protein
LEKFFEEVGKPGNDVLFPAAFRGRGHRQTVGSCPKVRRGDTATLRTIR